MERTYFVCEKDSNLGGLGRNIVSNVCVPTKFMCWNLKPKLKIGNVGPLEGD